MPSLKGRSPLFQKAKRVRLFSEYCGLGHSSGPPRHETDNLCRIHDDAYQEMIDRGENPYTTFNEADRAFLEALDKIAPKSGREAIIGQVAKGVFNFKSAITGTPLEARKGDPKMKRGREVDIFEDQVHKRFHKYHKNEKEQVEAFLNEGQLIICHGEDNMDTEGTI